MEVGKVVGSNDQTDYLVHVHAPGDAAVTPSPRDRAFGGFVAIPVDSARIVGLIYATQLVNPAYGAMGPRLSTERELPVFSPDYLPETATILRVVAIGTASRDGDGELVYGQKTPNVAPTIDAPVANLSEDEFLAFHGWPNRARLAYFARLLGQPFPALPDLLDSVLARLIASFPDDRRRLEVARLNLAWRAIVGARQ